LIKMKSAILSGFTALAMALTMTNQVQAQPAGLPLPTTRILAIGTFEPGIDPAAVRAILPKEVSDTVKLYLDGKIDQWFSLADRNGVVFLLNETDPRAAAVMLEGLPLGQAHLMHFNLIPLAPLDPLRQLPGISGGLPSAAPNSR
jgi:hypothetical protein